jgi:hypothetical protein
MNNFKNAAGAFVADLGCWSASGKSKGTVSYASPASPILWHHFHVDISTTREMVWEWKTDRLFPASGLQSPTLDSLASVGVQQPGDTGKSAAGWFVHLGNFASKENAKAFTRQLKAEGFDAKVSSIGTEATQRYRVRLGPIVDKDAALEIVAKLRARAHASTLVLSND